MGNVDSGETEFFRLLGNRVRDRRKALGISQEMLAEYASIHPTYVSRVEGGTNASMSVFRRVANALRMPLTQLVDVSQQRVEKDELMKAVVEIKSLDRKKQKLILETLKGMLAGMKE